MRPETSLVLNLQCWIKKGKPTCATKFSERGWTPSSLVTHMDQSGHVALPHGIRWLLFLPVKCQKHFLFALITTTETLCNAFKKIVSSLPNQLDISYLHIENCRWCPLLFDWVGRGQLIPGLHTAQADLRVLLRSFGLYTKSMFCHSSNSSPAVPLRGCVVVGFYSLKVFYWRQVRQHSYLQVRFVTVWISTLKVYFLSTSKPSPPGLSE